MLNVAAFNGDEATDDLYVAMFNGEAKFPVGRLKGKFYWDFAHNLAGNLRSHHVCGVEEGSFRDSTTWVAGLQLGELKRRGRVSVGQLPAIQRGVHRPEPKRPKLRTQPSEHARISHQPRLQSHRLAQGGGLVLRRVKPRRKHPYSFE